MQAESDFWSLEPTHVKQNMVGFLTYLRARVRACVCVGGGVGGCELLHDFHVLLRFHFLLRRHFGISKIYNINEGH